MTQTKHEIQTLLAGAGVRPLKRFGQHFLIDGNLMRKLLAGAGVQPADVVLEVGPGTGSLTEELLTQAGHVVAVEIDRTLQTICWDRLGERPNFTLIAGDVLESKGSIALAVRKALQDRQRELGGRLLLVANLPYQVASPLIINLLMGYSSPRSTVAADPSVGRLQEGSRERPAGAPAATSDSDRPEPRVTEMCFTIQAEVADRLQAPPGGKDYGPLTILTQALADVHRITRVPPEAFWPSPEVDSAIVRIVVRPAAALPDAVQRRLAELVHGCFNHRRKTLRWSLRELLDAAALARVESDGRWDLTLRPECITVDQWIALARFLM